MKKLAKNVVGALALTIAGSASAGWFDCLSPVIGLDYYQPWMKAKREWATVFPKDSYPGLTGYVGARFADCWGLELGYDHSSKKSKNFVLSDEFLNPTTVSNVIGTTNIRRNGGHLDLVGYMPVDACEGFEVFGTIGYGYVRPKVTFAIINSTGPQGLSYATGLNSIARKRGSVVRLGAGANYMVTDCIGFRAKLGFESTSSFRVNGLVQGTNGLVVAGSSRPFKSTASLALGGFVKF